MRFWSTKRFKSYNEDAELSIVITMKSGRVIEGKCTEKAFVDARYDLGRHSANPDSLIFLLSVIAHPSEFESIERA